MLAVGCPAPHAAVAAGRRLPACCRQGRCCAAGSCGAQAGAPSGPRKTDPAQTRRGPVRRWREAVLVRSVTGRAAGTCGQTAQAGERTSSSPGSSGAFSAARRSDRKRSCQGGCRREASGARLLAFTAMPSSSLQGGGGVSSRAETPSIAARSPALRHCGQRNGRPNAQPRSRLPPLTAWSARAAATAAQGWWPRRGCQDADWPGAHKPAPASTHVSTREGSPQGVR